MKDSGNLLKKFAFDKTKFLSLKDGEEIRIKFLSAEIVPSHFDNGESQSVRYHLDVDGVEKLLESSSGKLADQMSTMSEGDMISIERTGLGNNTKYAVTKVKE